MILITVLLASGDKSLARVSSLSMFDKTSSPSTQTSSPNFAKIFCPISYRSFRILLLSTNLKFYFNFLSILIFLVLNANFIHGRNFRLGKGALSFKISFIIRLCLQKPLRDIKIVIKNGRSDFKWVLPVRKKYFRFQNFSKGISNSNPSSKISL